MNGMPKDKTTELLNAEPFEIKEFLIYEKDRACGALLFDRCGPLAVGDVTVDCCIAWVETAVPPLTLVPCELGKPVTSSVAPEITISVATNIAIIAFWFIENLKIMVSFVYNFYV